MRKDEGSVGELMAAGLCILAMTVVMLSYLGNARLIQQKMEIGQIARKYILRMETVGTLMDEDRIALCEELEAAGATQIKLEGTTLIQVGYGEPVVLLRSETGQVGWAVGLFFLLFLAVFLSIFQQMALYRTASLYLEDALAASNLASAVVDLEEYGISHQILIEDSDAAYTRYQWALRENLNLSQAWESQGGGVIHSPILIVKYVIYNVNENKVNVYHYDENGLLTQWQESMGNVTAPNGVLIESTSVYSEVSFVVKGLFGVEVVAHMGKLADVTR